MNKFDEIRDLLALNISKMNDAMHTQNLLKKKVEEDKKPVLKGVLAVLGIVAIIAVCVYIAYRFFAPDYLDDFEDDLDDDFDDDFFDDDDDPEEI